MKHENICHIAFFCSFFSERSLHRLHVEQSFFVCKDQETMNVMYASSQKFGTCLIMQEMFLRQKDCRLQ